MLDYFAYLLVIGTLPHLWSASRVLMVPGAGEDPEIAAAEDDLLKAEAGESADESTQTTADAGSDEL